tara:strand:- start:1051 stop:2058 length:1008 start_codon:yes stop_codon:yes gene_type:complete
MLKDKQGIEDSYKLAQRYYMDDQLEKSLNIAKELLKNDSQNPKLNHLMGQILVKLGNYTDSLSFFYFSAKHEPKEINYLKSLINHLIHLGSINEAREYFEELKINYDSMSDEIISLKAKLNPQTKLDFFYKYLDAVGVFQCSNTNELMSVDGSYIPLLTNSFINWFETQTWEDLNFLELGSGSSTLYFSDFFKSITSYETNEKWFHRVFSRIPNSVKLIKCKSILSALSEDNIHSYDVILIDSGESRVDITKYIVENNFNGLIIFDNAEWYRKSINMLNSVGFIEIPFFGIRPIEDWVACTSVLIKINDISKFFNSSWEKIPKFCTYKNNNLWDL